jgi:hypothetical protein
MVPANRSRLSSVSAQSRVRQARCARLGSARCVGRGNHDFAVLTTSLIVFRFHSAPAPLLITCICSARRSSTHRNVQCDQTLVVRDRARYAAPRRAPCRLRSFTKSGTGSQPSIGPPQRNHVARTSTLGTTNTRMGANKRLKTHQRGQVGDRDSQQVREHSAESPMD